MADETSPSLPKPQPIASDSDSDSDSNTNNNENASSDAPVQWLATTRERRSTAGNRMKSLMANEDPDSDLELLFAEAEDDAGFSDVGDGEDADDAAAMEESDDEDDNGGGGEGQEEDLEGEKELERQAQEKKAAIRKRKAQEAIPARFRKKVRIDMPVKKISAPATTAGSSDVSTPLSASARSRRKKSERASWLPSATDAPIRASSRKTTRDSTLTLHAALTEREAKRAALVASVQRAAQSRNQRPRMTQEDRLREAALTERRNLKSLNRWEEAERAREEERRRRLEALQERKLRGPVVTFWSGSGDQPLRVVEVDERPKRFRRREEIKGEGEGGKVDERGAEKKAGEKGGAEGDGAGDKAKNVDKTTAEANNDGVKGEAMGVEAKTESTLAPDVAKDQDTTKGNPIDPQDVEMTPVDSKDAPPPHALMKPPPPPPPSASLPMEQLMRPPACHPSQNNRPIPTPTADVTMGKLRPPPGPEARFVLLKAPESNDQGGIKEHQEIKEHHKIKEHGMPHVSPEPTTLKISDPNLAENTHNMRSTRNAIILQNFNPAALEDKHVWNQILFNRKMPKAVVKSARASKLSTTPLCAITHRPAHYRDPRTGLAYADMAAYRSLQRIVRGEVRWSSVLGAWVGEEPRGPGVPAWFMAEPGEEDKENILAKPSTKSMPPPPLPRAVTAANSLPMATATFAPMSMATFAPRLAPTPANTRVAGAVFVPKTAASTFVPTTAPAVPTSVAAPTAVPAKPSTSAQSTPVAPMAPMAAMAENESPEK